MFATLVETKINYLDIVKTVYKTHSAKCLPWVESNKRIVILDLINNLLHAGFFVINYSNISKQS